MRRGRDAAAPLPLVYTAGGQLRRPRRQASPFRKELAHELTTWNIPVLALRGLTVFPHMNLTFDVERRISIAALERAMEGDQDIFLVTQREIGVNEPGEKDPVRHRHGVPHHPDPAAGPVLRPRDGGGPAPAHLRRLWQTEPFLQANVEAVPEEAASEAMRKSPRTEALLRQTYALFGEYAQQANGVPEEVVTTVMDSRDPGFLADYIAQNIALRYTDKQEILEEFSPFARLPEAQRLPGPGEQCAGL